MVLLPPCQMNLAYHFGLSSKRHLSFHSFFQPLAAAGAVIVTDIRLYSSLIWFLPNIFVTLGLVSYSDYINFAYYFVFKACVLFLLLLLSVIAIAKFQLGDSIWAREKERKTCKWNEIMDIKQFSFAINEPNKNKWFAIFVYVGVQYTLHFHCLY